MRIHDVLEAVMLLQTKVERGIIMKKHIEIVTTWDLTLQIFDISYKIRNNTSKNMIWGNDSKYPVFKLDFL